MGVCANIARHDELSAGIQHILFRMRGNKLPGLLNFLDDAFLDEQFIALQDLVFRPPCHNPAIRNNQVDSFLRLAPPVW